ncbi:hypothetical protein GmHk_02G003032 [Glycine max]|nr:hypothetical protein GmHk_02G003032 [Glycine max]
MEQARTKETALQLSTMNFQVTEQNNKNLKTSKLNRCIAFTSLSPSSTTTPPPTTTLTASLRSFSLLSLNFQIQEVAVTVPLVLLVNRSALIFMNGKMGSLFGKTFGL